MRRKILPLVISTIVVLFLVMGWYWIALAANDPLSPRDNPELLDMSFRVVTLDSVY